MDLQNIPSRPIWQDEKDGKIRIIDQRRLPHRLIISELNTVDDVIYAISEMMVRGAPLIGVTGAYGVYLAFAGKEAIKDSREAGRQAERIKSARPTAVNLAWAVDRTLEKAGAAESDRRSSAACGEAAAIAELEAENSRRIGRYGCSLIESIAEKKSGKPVNILTHCNAGRLACIEEGTATAPVYAAHRKGVPVHVWVDETRPLNQGGRLTAWELGAAGVPHTVITDNAGGHLMQKGLVDIVIVGTDRTTYTGDVANKIGTYLKALAARDNNIPFYVALPSSTFDWQISDGVAQIPIEERDPDEVRYMPGFEKTGENLLMPENSPAANYAFDVTPARLVTGFITERGICRAEESAIRELFSKPET
ncbi:MAG: S-methyl-5-thioribose-1-phosphate isomerase [Desulfobacteraceae bacterium]|nr:S-methyl-5-thioribose-1-phosphate isomerase [Desulfobacteraceae bacterium]